MHLSSLLLTALMLVLATSLFGQQPVNKHDWSNVKTLSSGPRITIRKRDGTKVSGNVETASDTAITVSANNGKILINRDDVRKMYIANSGGSKARSTAIGAGIGAAGGGGVAAMLLAATDGSDRTGNILGIGIAAGDGIGAAVGTDLGFGHKQTVIYEAK